MPYVVTKVGTVFSDSVAYKAYYPSAIESSSITNFPWDITIAGSTDHAGTGGIYLGGLKAGTDGTVLGNYETYNAGLARGAFDSFVTKPAANPVYSDAESGYNSTETPFLRKVASEFWMTAQVGISGTDQPTFLTKSTDLLNWTNYDRGDGEPFILDGNINDGFPANDQHRGYFRWAPNTYFTDQPYTYIGYGLHGGGGRPLNMMYGSNDAENWTPIAVVADSRFTDGSMPSNYGIWWNAMDPATIRDAGGGEFAILATCGTTGSGAASRTTDMYELYLAADGFTITRSPRLILSRGGGGADDEDEVSMPTMISHGGNLLIFYQGADTVPRNDLMLATAVWDDTIAKPAPVTRPNHDKIYVHHTDGSFPASVEISSGTPTFETGYIDFQANEAVRTATAYDPATVDYFESTVQVAEGGSATARPFVAVGDLALRPNNGAEYVKFNTETYLLTRDAGADADGPETPETPLNETDKQDDHGIRWDVASEELRFLAGESLCPMTILDTPLVDKTGTNLKVQFGNILNAIRVEAFTFRIGTAGAGIAPTISGTPTSNGTTVNFTFSESCIGEAQGIVIKEGGTPVSGSWTRSSLTTATFIRTSGAFSAAPTYDISSTDIRNDDLVQVQDVTAQSTDFTPNASGSFGVLSSSIKPVLNPVIRSAIS